jgi:DNA replication and repair protein RecF
LFVESLSLRNFRNYETLELEFKPSGYLFLGGNAQGKTNLLEAIHYLCVARSQRSASDDEIIRHGADHFSIKGRGFCAENRQLAVEIYSAREGGRRLKVNGSVRRKISDLLGLFCVVNFSPEDVAVVGGPPRYRRRFLNFLICQVNPSYLTSLQEYLRIVQQRNVALRSRPGGKWPGVEANELEAWDQQLVTVGTRIISKRGEVLRKLNPEVDQFHRRISDGGERLSLAYEPAGELKEDGDLADQFRAALARHRDRERKFGMTLVGPHRDEVTMTVNNMNLRAFGSQGQHRTAAIALKLAAAQFLEQIRGEQPILLLDDVFAELDQERTRLLFDLLAEFGQLFITTAKETDLAGCGENLHRMIISKGTVTSS